MSEIPPLSPPLAAPARPQSALLSETAQQFEAIFVRQVLAEARKAHFGGEALLGGQGMDSFRQMQEERFAEIAAKRGSYGLAKMIEAQLGATLGGGASTGSARAGLGATTKPPQPELVEGRAQPLVKRV